MRTYISWIANIVGPAWTFRPRQKGTEEETGTLTVVENIFLTRCTKQAAGKDGILSDDFIFCDPCLNVKRGEF
jgi:hypothetical protein